MKTNESKFKIGDTVVIDWKLYKIVQRDVRYQWNEHTSPYWEISPTKTWFWYCHEDKMTKVPAPIAYLISIFYNRTFKKR